MLDKYYEDSLKGSYFLKKFPNGSSKVSIGSSSWGATFSSYGRDSLLRALDYPKGSSERKYCEESAIRHQETSANFYQNARGFNRFVELTVVPKRNFFEKIIDFLFG